MGEPMLEAPDDGDGLLVTVTIWSDFGCPFCYVAEAILDRVAERIPFRLDWRGFWLHPEIPDDGRPLADIIPRHLICGVVDNVRRLAERYDLPLQIGDRIISTRRALIVAERARELGLQDTFRRAGMRALWAQGRDLANPAVLADVAVEAGLPAEAVLDLDDGHALAPVRRRRSEGEDQLVTGIPTLFVGPYPLVGVQPEDVLARWIRRAEGS
jgi:predicted DsbA family dithiol-disulfide isomerase